MGLADERLHCTSSRLPNPWSFSLMTWHLPSTFCSCMEVSVVCFRLTYTPKTERWMAAHVLVRAVICSRVLPIKMWLSGLQELLLELGTCVKERASLAAGVVRLQPCRGGCVRLPLKLTASVKFSPLSPSSPSDPERLCFPLQLIVSTRCQNGKSTLPLRVRQRDAEQKEMTASIKSFKEDA